MASILDKHFTATLRKGSDRGARTPPTAEEGRRLAR